MTVHPDPRRAFPADRPAASRRHPSRRICALAYAGLLLVAVRQLDSREDAGPAKPVADRTDVVVSGRRAMPTLTTAPSAPEGWPLWSGSCAPDRSAPAIDVEPTPAVPS